MRAPEPLSSDSSRLLSVLAALRELHGAPNTDPQSAWSQILWENCCYLADDDRRATAFALLDAKTGLEPRRILRASDRSLLDVTMHGIVPDLFASKLRDCAQLVIDEFGGDLDDALASMNDAAARRALRKFHGIGEPGAEKILLHAHRIATVALESNGLRVVERLGYVGADANYSRQWKAARRAIAAEAPGDVRGLMEMYQLLRRHGQTLCLRSKPCCSECPLTGNAAQCPFP